MANKYEKMSECFHNYRNAMMNYNLSSVRLESRLAGKISITSDMQMTPPLWQKVKKK